MPYKTAGYGWVKDDPDPRDLLFSPSPVIAARPLPKTIDLRPGCPPVYNQGQIGSCTANAIAAAFEFAQKKQLLADFMPSRLFIYYNERVMEHSTNKDEGAQIRDGIKSVANIGVPPEKIWPYSQRLTVVKEKPKPRAYDNAAQHKVIAYHRIYAPDPEGFLTLMKSCLADGYPFVFGFNIYSEFESNAIAATGMLNLPDRKKEKPEGGHAVMAVGYDDMANTVLVRNSWGAHWALEGYFWMPYAYINDHKLASDFWTIRGVTGTASGIPLGTVTKAKAKAAKAR